MSAYGLKTPCSNCPFRTDIRPYIRAERVREILTSNEEFHCHKTIVVDPSDDEDHWGDVVEDEHAQVCAGFLICLEHDDAPNQMMRIAERLGMYDRTKLRMEAPVYRGVNAAINAHKRMAKLMEHTKPTRAPPRTVDGVTFRCYRVGISDYHWIALTDNLGTMRIRMVKENVFVAWSGNPCPANCIGKNFRKFETAASTLIKHVQQTGK
jgi:hypothetical protein